MQYKEMVHLIACMYIAGEYYFWDGASPFQNDDIPGP